MYSCIVSVYTARKIASWLHCFHFISPLNIINALTFNILRKSKTRVHPLFELLGGKGSKKDVFSLTGTSTPLSVRKAGILRVPLHSERTVGKYNVILGNFPAQC